MNVRVKSMGLFSTIFVILLILKLCGLTAISWWWVFSPLMFSLMFGVILLVLTVAIGVVVWLADDDDKRVR